MKLKYVVFQKGLKLDTSKKYSGWNSYHFYLVNTDGTITFSHIEVK